MNKAFILLSTLLSLFLFSCSTRYGMLTIATTKNVNINMQEFEKIAEGVTGESKKPIIIVIPTGTPSIEDAIEDALRKGKGEIMQNVVIYYKWFYIPYIYGEYKFEVRGDVFRIKQKSSSSLNDKIIHDAQKAYDVTLTSDGVIVKEIKSISEICINN